jgi:type II secretory pathway component PulC
MRRSFYLILVGLFLTIALFVIGQVVVLAQSDEAAIIRDPFDSLLPAPPTVVPNNQPIIRNNFIQPAANPVAKPLNLSVEGILWGTDKPSAIINGVVYKIGDTLKDIDVKLYDIQKNKILIIYEGRLQDFGVNPRKENDKDNHDYGTFNKRKEGGHK